MTAPSYDLSQWPILRVTMLGDGPTASEFAAHLSFLEQKLQGGPCFGLIVDARNAPPLDARSRQALGQLWRRSYARDPHAVAGIAVVLASAVERGVLTAIFWAAGRTYPHRTFATTTEAADWLRERLDAGAMAARG